MSVCP